MSRRTLAWIALSLALLIAAGVAVDVFIETDEERVLALADDLSGPLSAATVRAGAGRWVDLNRAPLEVSALGLSELYEAGDEAALFERADGGLRHAYGGSVTVLSSQARVDGQTARLTTRLLLPRLGLANGTWDLERRGDDWLLVRVALTR